MQIKLWLPTSSMTARVRVIRTCNSRDSWEIIGDLLEVWMTRFKSVIELLSNNINHLASRMTAFSEDHNSSLSIRYSMIICFTAKADLCRTITGIRLLSSVDRQHHNSQCEDSLRCVVQLTEGLDPDDFNFLDPFLGVRDGLLWLSFTY